MIAAVVLLAVGVGTALAVHRSAAPAAPLAAPTSSHTTSAAGAAVPLPTASPSVTTPTTATSSPATPPSPTGNKPSATSPLAQVPWASLRYPIDCATTGLGIRIEDVRYADITGDGKLDALVQVICETSTSAGSDQVEVFDGSSSPQQPESIGVLLKVTDPEGIKHQVKKLALLTYPWVICGLGGLVGGRRG